MRERERRSEREAAREKKRAREEVLAAAVVQLKSSWTRSLSADTLVNQSSLSALKLSVYLIIS